MEAAFASEKGVIAGVDADPLLQMYASTFNTEEHTVIAGPVTVSLMATQPKICVVGSTMIDLISKVPRLPKLGETLVGIRFTSVMAAKAPIKP